MVRCGVDVALSALVAVGEASDSHDVHGHRHSKGDGVGRSASVEDERCRRPIGEGARKKRADAKAPSSNFGEIARSG
uniref:Secreted protein n=1 Tax=Mesocestoides corti TaxID=53468 RepID=A0A5K3FFT7_MESCO